MKRKPSPGVQKLNRQSDGRSDQTSNRLRPGRVLVWGLLGGIVILAAGLWLIIRHPREPIQSPAPSAGAQLELERASTPSGSAGKRTENESVLADQINRANQLVAQGQFPAAVALLREAEKTNPDDEDVHYNLGIALARMDKNDEAIKEYEKALTIFPDYAEAHNNLGNLLLRLGNRIEALRHFEQAIKITPEYASAWNNFGTALRQLGRTNEATGYFREAARLNTNYWQARFNLGTSYLENGMPAEARAEFEAVLKLQPEFPPAQLALKQLDGPAAAVPHAD